MSQNRTQELIDIIKYYEFKIYVKVGIYYGDNILEIAKALPELQCYGIDPSIT